eukprot:scaffold6290_cov125-Isochrysis_galbana.AAC.6
MRRETNSDPSIKARSASASCVRVPLPSRSKEALSASASPCRSLSTNRRIGWRARPDTCSADPRRRDRKNCCFGTRPPRTPPRPPTWRLRFHVLGGQTIQCG